MKNVLFSCLLSLVFAGCHSARQAQRQPLPLHKAPSRTTALIIYYDATVDKVKLLEAANKYKARIIYEFNELNGLAVTVPPSVTQEEAIRFFGAVPGVLSVQPDRVNNFKLE